VPFTGAIGVRRIAAAVTVGGYGVAINDVTQTTGPSLVLVDAGVNVMGSPVYNMLNNNGYYCMKVNVNVKTALTVNLACNARLADNSVQVNVGGTTGGTTSVVGVNVNSNVVVRPMTPSGGACY
jgi:4-diphosphocytidyl-2C-methyl-D-erythritol kinase